MAHGPPFSSTRPDAQAGAGDFTGKTVASGDFSGKTVRTIDETADALPVRDESLRAAYRSVEISAEFSTKIPGALARNQEERSLSKYRFIQKIAQGGIAEIYLAQRHGSSEICVIKQLLAPFAGDSIVGNRFLREAQ